MKTTTKIFHIISYLQYPLIVTALVLYYPLIKSYKAGNLDWELVNYILILFGTALSFSTLQDTTKTQNKISKRVWSDPVKGKIMLIFFAVMSHFFIIIGFIFMIYKKNSMQENVAVGIIVLGIGMIGILKSAIEMFENHRLDKNRKE